MPSPGEGLHRPLSAGAAAERDHPAARPRPAPDRRGDGDAGLAADPGDRVRRRRARHALYPRLRGRDLLHDVQPRAGRPLPRPGLRHHAVHAARLGRCARRLLRQGAEEGPHHRGRPVHLDRGRMPRRLRQRADGPDQRRQLRGPDLREHDRDPRGARQGRDAEARPAGRSPDQLPRRRPDHAARDGLAKITIIGGNGHEALAPSYRRRS